MQGKLKETRVEPPYATASCFSQPAEDLSNAMPIPEDNRLEWVLGIALVHYSMKAGIKKF